MTKNLKLLAAIAMVNQSVQLVELWGSIEKQCEEFVIGSIRQDKKWMKQRTIKPLKSLRSS